MLRHYLVTRFGAIPAALEDRIAASDADSIPCATLPWLRCVEERSLDCGAMPSLPRTTQESARSTSRCCVSVPSTPAGSRPSLSRK
jgi:hypothetical protein